MAEHGGAVLPVMAERHHPCCHTRPGAPLGSGKAPRVTMLCPVGMWVGGAAASACHGVVMMVELRSKRLRYEQADNEDPEAPCPPVVQHSATELFEYEFAATTLRGAPRRHVVFSL